MKRSYKGRSTHRAEDTRTSWVFTENALTPVLERVRLPGFILSPRKSPQQFPNSYIKRPFPGLGPWHSSHTCDIHISYLVFKSWFTSQLLFFQSQLSANAHSERQWVRTHALGFLPPSWETKVEFSAPGLASSSPHHGRHVGSDDERR